jgi:hypothetical protein
MTDQGEFGRQTCSQHWLNSLICKVGGRVEDIADLSPMTGRVDDGLLERCRMNG